MSHVPLPLNIVLLDDGGLTGGLLPNGRKVRHAHGPDERQGLVDRVRGGGEREHRLARVVGKGLEGRSGRGGAQQPSTQ